MQDLTQSTQADILWEQSESISPPLTTNDSSTMISMSNPIDLELRRYVLDHTLRQVQSIRVDDDPFPHFSIHPFFPHDVYSDLVKRLPSSETYEAFGYEKNRTSDGDSSRKRFRLENSWLERLPADQQPFWFSIRSALGSLDLKRAVFAKLADALSFRYQCDPSAASELPGYALPELFRETTGYRIKPHPDTRKKVVTMQISLATAADQQGLGTEFYRRSLRPAHWLREPKGFELVKAMPFLPNAAYAFAVLNTLRLKSWHGRSALPDGSGVRNSILNIWYHSPEHANKDLITEHQILQFARHAG